MNKAKLHDIFPVVPMVDYSLYYFLLAVFLAMGSLTLFYLYIYKRKSWVHQYLHILESCNMKKSKRTAQQFSYYAKRLAKTQAQKEMFLAINTALYTYKYDKISKELPTKLQKEIHLFLQKIRQENV